MLGIFFIPIGFLIAALGMGLEGFDNPKAGREIKKRFILIGLTLSLLGIILVIFTI
jgi:uncharacterized membrane protein